MISHGYPPTVLIDFECSPSMQRGGLRAANVESHRIAHVDSSFMLR